LIIIPFTLKNRNPGVDPGGRFWRVCLGDPGGKPGGTVLPGPHQKNAIPTVRYQTVGIAFFVIISIGQVVNPLYYSVLY